MTVRDEYYEALAKRVIENFRLTENWIPQMNQDTFNLSVRKFLKIVGVNSQREIEHAVARAIASAAIAGTESFPAKITLEVPALKLKVEFEDAIKLE